MNIEVRPLTPGLWEDFEALMGPKGGAEGCWCMLWRVPASVYKDGRGEPNRQAMRARVLEGGRPPGLIAYLDRVPAGWVSIAPRTEFPRMENSRIVGPVDTRPVWSVTCFFIKPGSRGRGVATALLAAACGFAAQHGAQVVEGYPVDPHGERYANAFAWTGLMRLFEKAGFAEVARRSEKRPIMRKEVGHG
ncbi:MAG TPA: GNAT family N-acetyltransferase [Thermohalobaculum sp.]|nr:GNAT family N-acetyltransferase [Thermohalobaculum sp.]